MHSPSVVDDSGAADRLVLTASAAEPPPGSRDRNSEPLAVQLRDVHKFFGSVEAVAGVNLSIRSGEVLAFLGPNGAGKTSTLDMILGLSQPTSGEVEVYGMAPRRAITRGLVSAVMQSGGLLKDFTVEETVLYMSKSFAVSRPVGEVLERAGITRIANRLVGKCSGGEQQRLRFAIALLPIPSCCSLTSRRREWMSRGAASSGRRSATTPPGAERSSLPRTTSRKLMLTPIGSCSSARAGSSPTVRPPRSKPSRPGAPSGRPCQVPMSCRCVPSQGWTTSTSAETPCSPFGE
jgi:ABC-type uncharacterized transport system YnjBCD ATPase subunit